MKEIKTILNPINFPNQLATDAEKATEDYGLRIGQAIQYEWFKRDGQSCRYWSRWMEFNNRRLYARGEQSIAKYKKEFAVDGDISYLNLDWTPVPIIPKFVDIVVNGMSDRLFTVKAFAQDALAAEARNAYQENIEKDMVAKPLLMQADEQLGVDIFNTPKEDLPESSEELQLHMQLNYKPAIEIAEEEGLSTIFEMNHYEDIQKRTNYDMSVVGMGVNKHSFYQGNGCEN